MIEFLLCACLYEWSRWFKTSIGLDQQMNRIVRVLWIFLSSHRYANLCSLFHPLCLWGWSSDNIFLAVSALDWARLNFAIDPVDVMGDTGVDPRLVLLTAPIAPADHAHQSHLVLVFADKRTTRVSLLVE